MTLEELKKRATAGELALIEKVEATLQADIRRQVIGDLDRKIQSWPESDFLRQDMVRPRVFVEWFQKKWKELQEEDTTP